MYGPDPFMIAAHAQVLADEQARAERRPSLQPLNDGDVETTAKQSQTMLEGALRGLRALFSLPVATLRGYVRPRQASP